MTRNASRLPRLLALLSLLGACSPNFPSPTRVDALRLLALKAEPPEIAPAAATGDAGDATPRPPDRANLHALVADPAQLADAARRSTVVYLACTPDPSSATPSPCDSMDRVTDLGSLAAMAGAEPSGCSSAGSPAAEAGVGVLGGVSFAGVESCDAAGCGSATLHRDPSDPSTALAAPPARYVLPDSLRLTPLPASAPARVLGVQVALLAIAIDASPDELFPGGDPCAMAEGFAARLPQLLAERAHVTSTKRLAVRGPDATDAPNLNPQISGIARGAVPVPAAPDAPAPYALGERPRMAPLLPAPSAELLQSYSKYDTAGQFLESTREIWAYSWFTTAGSFEKAHTQSADDEAVWDVPPVADTDGLPSDGRVRLYAVVRDQRGGMDWVVREVRVGAPR